MAPRELSEARIMAVVYKEAERAVYRGLLATQRAVQEVTPAKTGTARRSITATRPVRNGNEIRGSVGSNLPYVRWLDQGTGLYGPRHQRITPKAKQALAFVASSAKGKGKPFTLAGRARNTATPRAVMSGLVVVRSVKGIQPMRLFDRGIAASREARRQALASAGPAITKRLREAR